MRITNYEGFEGYLYKQGMDFLIELYSNIDGKKFCTVFHRKLNKLRNERNLKEWLRRNDLGYPIRAKYPRSQKKLIAAQKEKERRYRLHMYM